MRVAVTGATGFVGRHVVRELLRRGVLPVAAARDPSRARNLLPEGVEVRRADLSPESLEMAFAGCDAVVHLVAVIVERGEETFDSVNVGGTQAAVEAARRAGVTRFVHMSAFGAGPDPRFPYLRSKWLGEEVVRGSGLAWTILRPSVILGEGAGFLHPILTLARFSPVYPLPLGGRTRFQPVAAADVAEAVARCLERGETVGKELDLGGPEVLTFREITERILREAGMARALVSVPLWTAYPFAFFQEKLARRPLVTRGQLAMVMLDNVPGKGGWGTLGMKPSRVSPLAPGGRG